ncbi:MAG: hypothetical protein GC134_03140 [Proteobacteria bacterium]|nr:hypothetical protein [Pseudomonadota bacterium]
MAVLARWASVFLLTACAPLVAHAQQTDFKVYGDARVVTYRFGWMGFDGKPINAFFRLPRNNVDVSAQDFKEFDNQAANDYVKAVIKAYNDTHTNPNVQMSEENGGVKFTSATLDKAAFDKQISDIKALRQKAMDTFIDANLYTKISDHSIMPDHKRIASMYVPRMRPVAEALAHARPSRSERDNINTVLSFLQNIPYDKLEDRTTSNGAGFVTPINLLTTNKGDCDSKAVAMASILRNLYPKMRIVMIYIPGHAFVGLNMPLQSGDTALQIGKYKFVLAEPVGPAMTPVGKVAPESYQKLSQYQFSYQEVPF